MTVIMNKRLLKTKAAADYLSIGRSTLCLWIRQDKVPSIKVGKNRLFDVEELDAFIESLKIEKEDK